MQKFVWIFYFLNKMIINVKATKVRVQVHLFGLELIVLLLLLVLDRADLQFEIDPQERRKCCHQFSLFILVSSD